MGLKCCHGEGNGKPLQYSRLENPMDGGAWWAASVNPYSRLKADPGIRKQAYCSVHSFIV